MGIEKTCVLRLGQMVRGEFLSGLRRRTLISVYHAKPEKVAVIHNLNDLRQLPMVRDVPPGMWEEIDFVECLRRGIDAVELCWYGEEYQDQRADDLYLALYGWDCDSIVVLNPDAVIQI